jgi:putative tricarboxylic transport membrane protein
VSYMSIIDRVSWSVLLLFGIFVIYESLQIKYYGSDFGPGPGFFSFWMGILVVGLSVVEIGRTVGKRVPLPADFFPDRAAVVRIGSLLGALIAVMLLLNPLGYSLTMALFCLFLLRALGKQPWWLTVLLTLAGSFGTAYIFRLLQVILPGGILGI